MANDTHTPGPWHATHNSWDISTVYSSSGQVAECRIDSEVTEETQDHFEPIKEANARLIAAAPELFAALQKEQEWREREAAGALDDGWDYEIMVASYRRAAIAKAQGDA